MSLSAARILELLGLLNGELARKSIKGELYLAGGAAMCLAFKARDATKDVDALLMPKEQIREAARAVAACESLPENWLNDAVKGFFSEQGSFDVYLELSHLRVYTPHPGYLLAMKCLAMRLGEEFHDVEDVKRLLLILGVRKTADAEGILARYYPLERYPARARYILEEILAMRAAE
jgi:hypothetical protein